MRQRRNTLDPPKPKGHAFGTSARKRLVRVGKNLHILTDEDVDYIMDVNHTEAQVHSRYTAARLRR